MVALVSLSVLGSATGSSSKQTTAPAAATTATTGGGTDASQTVSPPAKPPAKPKHHKHKPHPKPKPRPKPKPQPKPKPRPKPATRHYAGIPAIDVPNHALTPGVAFPVGVSQVCVSGYASSVRDVPDSEKEEAYARYRIPHVPYQHEVDHLVSLEIGGSNDIRNLWPEPYAGRWGARTKDVLENKLHDLVCAGQLGLKAAQQQEAGDWVAAYRKYVSTALPSMPSSGGSSGGSSSGGSSSGSSGGSSSAGGYYASGYPTASTIYCADDSEWKSLSTTYLQHFPTFAAALAAHPGYHLHQPC
jgi:hypothetical protein